MEVAKTINHSNSLRGSTSKKMPSPEIVDLVPDSAQPSYMSPSVILNKPQQSTTMLPQIVNVQSMAKGFNNNFNKTSVNFNHHFNTMRRNNNQSKSSTTLFPMNISKRVGDKLPMPNQKKLREKVVSKPEDGSWQNPFSVKKIQNQEEDEDSVSVINEVKYNFIFLILHHFTTTITMFFFVFSQSKSLHFLVQLILKRNY